VRSAGIISNVLDDDVVAPVAAKAADVEEPLDTSADPLPQSDPRTAGSSMFVRTP
jgi:hypothetical protein